MHHLSCHPDKHKASDRDAAIVEHVSRFRLSTNQVIGRLLFPGKGPAAVRKVTARLCASAYLRSRPLRHPQNCFFLGQRSVAEMGLPPHWAWPPGPQSLATEYAILSYATLGVRYHRRLRRHELKAELPWLPREHGEAAYCLDETDRGSVIELLQVDLGGTADHVARKCDRVIQERLRLEAFRQTAASRRLRLVVITGHVSKAEAIRRSLSRHIWPAGLELHLAVVPCLPGLSTGVAKHA